MCGLAVCRCWRWCRLHRLSPMQKRMSRARGRDRWSLGDVRPLHVRAGGRRACHTHGSRRLGIAVSVICGGLRVLVSLHGARGILLRWEGIATGAAQRGTWGLSVRRGYRTRAKTRRPEIVRRDLLELRRRWPVGVGIRGSLKRGRGCERARGHMVRAIVVGDVPSGRRLSLAVVAKRLLWIGLHRCRRRPGLLRTLLRMLLQRRRFARGPCGGDVIVQHSPEIHFDVDVGYWSNSSLRFCSVLGPTRPRVQTLCFVIAILLLKTIERHV
jgi:hypothetical protein